MLVKKEKVSTTTLYDVEFEGKLYKMKKEEDHITGLTDYELYLDGEEQDDELLDKILNPLNYYYENR
jgi:hypothetical protein